MLKYFSVKNVRLKPGILCFLFFSGVSLFSQSPVLFQNQIQTRLTRDEGYITNGAVLLDIEPEIIIETMSNLSIIEQWIFEGMGEEAARTNKLKVALNHLDRYPENNDSCTVNFSLLVTKHWLIRNRTMDVTIEVSPDNTGWLTGIFYDLPIKSLFIKEGGYKVYIINMGMGRSLVVYNFTVHLSGISETLFNQKLYKQNIEWYIHKIQSNCINFLQK